MKFECHGVLKHNYMLVYMRHRGEQFMGGIHLGQPGVMVCKIL